MSVQLKRLIFSNMFSYGGNNIIDFTKNQITQLTGENGSGKTSIPLILQELLYNKNVKSIKKADILNRNIQGNTWSAELEFSVHSDEYKIKCKRTGANSTVILLKNGKDISEHKVLDTYKIINNLIGRDFETFSQLTYQSSTNSLEFLKSADSARKKFLISLFNLDRYLEIGDELKERLAPINTALAQKQGELKSIEDFLAQNDIPEKLELIEVVEPDDSLLDRIKQLDKEIDAYTQLCNEIDKNHIIKQELESLQFDIGMQKPESDISAEEVRKLEAQISSNKLELSKIRKQLNGLDLSNHCYACGQEIDNSKSIELKADLEKSAADIEEAIKAEQTVLNVLTSKLDLHFKALKAWDQNNKAIAKFETLSSQLDKTLPDDYPSYAEINNIQKELKAKYKAQQEAYRKALDTNKSILVRNSKIDALIAQVRQFLARQELVKNDIVELQQQVAIFEVLKKSFSTTGIVAYKIENLSKQLEELINYYLAQLSDGQFQIVFRLNKEKLNIMVINNGREVEVDSLSGGEFSRLQTSVLLAVRKTLSKMGSNSINLLFLDEVTGVLDEAGKEKLIDVLSNETELNVFIVSHDYSHPLVPKLQVTKQKGISTVTA